MVTWSVGSSDVRLVIVFTYLPSIQYAMSFQVPVGAQGQDAAEAVRPPPGRGVHATALHDALSGQSRIKLLVTQCWRNLMCCVIYIL